MLTNFNALRLDVARNSGIHIKKTLPPSLGGLPGEAEIRYFVKVTVQRPAFYKENFRSVSAVMSGVAKGRRLHRLGVLTDTGSRVYLSCSCRSSPLASLQTNASRLLDDLINSAQASSNPKSLVFFVNLPQPQISQLLQCLRQTLALKVAYLTPLSSLVTKLCPYEYWSPRKTGLQRRSTWKR